jgi:hypothetical protein
VLRQLAGQMPRANPRASHPLADDIRRVYDDVHERASCGVVIRSRITRSREDAKFINSSRPSRLRVSRGRAMNGKLSMTIGKDRY